jgi:putative heme-binding domain-containing protein
LALALPARAQRDAKIPDPDPEIERRALQVAEGFEINLFAADPLLAKPIQMNFDAAGRLWVASSEVYPQIAPGQKANDKIIILEDTNGDGRADKTTVFADGLLIPTGVEPGDGGAYVGHSTELVHLADTDGDGKADRRRTVLSGFGTEDTHHIVHTLRWGPDGMLYFNQSIYIHSHIETPYGVRRLGGGGVWQLRPESQQLEVFVRGFWNPWGHHFDRWGQSFLTDGANGEGITYGLPGASYPATPGATRIWHGLNPGSPKHCGLEILSGRHLPEDWRGNVLTNDFRGHRVCRFVLRDDGSGYSSQEQAELVKSAHPAFRPIDVKIGPDGAIYIADWYNPIIQHGEVDFRDPRRDHTHGRIWRVTAKGRPLAPRPRLMGVPTAELLEALKAPEDWTRHQAKRQLKECGAKVLPELAAWVGKLDKNDREHEHHLLEVLWTYQSLDTVEPKLLTTLLHAAEPRVQAAAVRVLGYWQGRLPDAPSMLAECVAADHPRVRLEAVRALGGPPRAEALAIALRVLDRPMDPLLDYALWLTVRELEPAWLPALQSGQLTFAGKEGHLVRALEAAASPAAVRLLVEFFQAGRIAKDREESVLTSIGAQGGAEELGQMLARILALEDADPAGRARLLTILEQATRRRGVRPAGDLTRIQRLFDSNQEALQAAALRAAGQWHVEEARPQLLQRASATAAPAAVRQAALDGLVLLGGPETRKALIEMCDASHPANVRHGAVAALAALAPAEAARHAAALLAADPSEEQIRAMLSAFLQQRSGADALARALDGRKLPADVAKLALRNISTGRRTSPALEQALTKAGNLKAVQRVLTPAEMAVFVLDVQQQGNAARGEAIFRRKELACLKCHAVAGAGGQVGPDLLSIGASAPVDYLVESLLQPNKAIKENYHSTVVATLGGQVFTGIKVRETNAELVLRNVEDQETTIPVKDIAEKSAGLSLMPEGTVDGLTRSELLDLVRFLSELGKVGPYSVSPARVVRRWQVLEATGPAHTLLSRTHLATAADPQADLVWSPAYSQVSGALPLEALPRFHWQNRPGTFGFARCQLDVSTAGKVLLRLNAAAGVTLWKDGVPVDAQKDLVLNLPRGTHTLTFQIDLEHRTESLRCELDDVPESPARVRMVGGK